MKQEPIQGSSIDSNQSIEFQYLTNNICDELVLAHQRAKKFVQQLGSLRETPIIQPLANYCREIKLASKSADFVLDLMEARLLKIIKNNKLKKNWSTEDLQILVWLISKYIEKNGIQSHQTMNKQDWDKISSMVAGSTPKSCMFKFISLKKFKLAQHKWQKEQENLLSQIIQQIGTNNWKHISEKLYERNPTKRIFRTPKQCREHWSCYLDPKIKKGPWQRDEDKKLLQTVLENNCQKKWSAIKQQFEGRTENALKNRYNLLLEKQKKIFADLSEEDLLTELLKQHNNVGAKNQSKDSVERQSARSTVSMPVPVIPEERRNMTVAFQPGILIFFNQGSCRFEAL